MEQSQNAFAAGAEYDSATGTFVSRTPGRAPRSPAEPSCPVPGPSCAEAPAAAPCEPAVPLETLGTRHDGWTPARRRLFLKELADCGSVTEAASRVGMSRGGAYRLRRRSQDKPFGRAWDAALGGGVKK